MALSRLHVEFDGDLFQQRAGWPASPEPVRKTHPMHSRCGRTGTACPVPCAVPVLWHCSDHSLPTPEIGPAATVSFGQKRTFRREKASMASNQPFAGNRIGGLHCCMIDHAGMATVQHAKKMGQVGNIRSHRASKICQDPLGHIRRRMAAMFLDMVHKVWLVRYEDKLVSGICAHIQNKVGLHARHMPISV